MISCLGGGRPAPGSDTWGCKSREHCANYLERGQHPVERLCGVKEETEYLLGGSLSKDGSGVIPVNGATIGERYGNARQSED